MVENKDIKIIFMGTSGFALPAFKKLLASKFSIITTFCQSDKKAGRGLKCSCCPVKESSLKHKIPVFQPKILKEKKVIDKIRDLRPDLLIVAAYGLLIPQEILEIPREGAINIHPSLLPSYRGPSPIQTAILNGEQKTGVSIMLLDQKMDHGPIISQKEIKIEKKDNQIILGRKLAALGAKLLLQALPLYISGKIKPKDQDHKKASFTKLLEKEAGKINWNKEAIQIERKARAYLGWPGTYTKWQEKRIIILESEAIASDRYRDKNGEVFEVDSALHVQCGKNILKIKKLQLSGKKPVTGAEFLRGYPAIVDSHLE